MFKIILILLISCQYSSSTVTTSVVNNAQFVHNELLTSLGNVSSINSYLICACQCWNNSLCITVTYDEINSICSLFASQLSQGQLKIMVTNKNITTVTFPNRDITMYGVNLVINGDGETGPCEMAGSVTHPTGWSYNGLVTQISYNNTKYSSQSYWTPGPNDRGRCLFTGYNSTNTTMFQRVYLIAFINDIDSGSVLFNLSAWLGGYAGQNDSVSVSVIFENSNNQIIGNRTTIGPVLNPDRHGLNATVFCNKTNVVPVQSRWMTISVTFIKCLGVWNDGSVDNIRVEFKRI